MLQAWSNLKLPINMIKSDTIKDGKIIAVIQHCVVRSATQGPSGQCHSQPIIIGMDIARHPKGDRGNVWM